MEIVINKVTKIQQWITITFKCNKEYQTQELLTFPYYLDFLSNTIQSFQKYLPSTILGAWDMSVTDEIKISAFMELIFQWGDTDNNQ